MSVATEITRIKGNIEASYEQAEAKGAEMPATLNSDNLPQCIASIPTSPTPPPPTGDIAVIIYTYDSTNAKYVESVYTRASKGDTITLPAIADVAEANDGTANYNPALTADGWSGDVEVVNGQFTIPDDWKLPEIVLMACYYTTNGKMCFVYTDKTHAETTTSELQPFCTNIFCNQSVANLNFGQNDNLVRSLVGPNTQFYNNLANPSNTSGAIFCTICDYRRSLSSGSLTNAFRNRLGIERICGLGRLKASSVASISNAFYGCSSLQSLDLSGWDTQNVTTLANTFNGCSSLQSLKIPDFNLVKVTAQASLQYAFANCRNLLYIKLAEDGQETGFFNFASALTMDFSPCLYLGVGNGWKDHLLACTPQQSETKNIKLSAATISSFDEDELQQLQDRGYTIAT